MVGTTIANRYRIDSQLGVGGMGVVYRAYDVKLRREVAFKVIAPHLMQQEKAKARFLREAQALAGLSHPNIVMVFDLLEDPSSGAVYIIMELMEGHSLRQKLKAPDRPSFNELTVQICRALESAHSKNILHRDIKPENIFVCADGTLKLMDFGLARMLDSGSAAQSSVVVGTASYMAPEQLRGEKQDARTDLYALGIVLYEYVTGVLPFVADNPGAVMLKHLTENPTPLRNYVPNVAPEVEAVILKLLSKRPEDRFASAAAVREALSNPAVAAAIVAATPAAPKSAIPMTAPAAQKQYASYSQRNRPRRGWVPMFLLLLLLGGGAAAFFFGQKMLAAQDGKKGSKGPKGKTSKATNKGGSGSSQRSVGGNSGGGSSSTTSRPPANPTVTKAVNAFEQAQAKADASPPASEGTGEPATGGGGGRLRVNATGKVVTEPPNTIRLSVSNSDECNVMAYGIKLGDSSATRLDTSSERLSDNAGAGTSLDVTFSEDAQPDAIVLVASREELSELPSSLPLPAAFQDANAGAGQLLEGAVALRRTIVEPLRQKALSAGHTLTPGDIAVRIVRVR